jgi:molybdate transport system permease protein
MDWAALALSFKLGALTILILAPIGVFAGRALAFYSFRGRALAEAAIALPLILPPTVLGYYLLTALGATSPLGAAWRSLTGRALVFSFDGLLVASILINLPFAIQPMQRGFEAIAKEVREAAACSGLSPWRVLWRIDLPLAWPSLVTGLVLAFAHTLGEFGVVLMVGGAIPGETRTIAIAIYDRVEAFDNNAAALMSATLLALSLAALALTYALSRNIGRTHG